MSVFKKVAKVIENDFLENEAKYKEGVSDVSNIVLDKENQVLLGSKDLTNEGVELLTSEEHLTIVKALKESYRLFDLKINHIVNALSKNFEGILERFSNIKGTTVEEYKESMKEGNVLVLNDDRMNGKFIYYVGEILGEDYFEILHLDPFSNRLILREDVVTTSNVNRLNAFPQIFSKEEIVKVIEKIWEEAPQLKPENLFKYINTANEYANVCNKFSEDLVYLDKHFECKNPRENFPTVVSYIINESRTSYNLSEITRYHFYSDLRFRMKLKTSVESSNKIGYDYDSSREPDYQKLNLPKVYEDNFYMNKSYNKTYLSQLSGYDLEGSFYLPKDYPLEVSEDVKRFEELVAFIEDNMKNYSHKRTRKQLEFIYEKQGSVSNKELLEMVKEEFGKLPSHYNKPYVTDTVRKRILEKGYRIQMVGDENDADYVKDVMNINSLELMVLKDYLLEVPEVSNEYIDNSSDYIPKTEEFMRKLGVDVELNTESNCNKLNDIATEYFYLPRIHTYLSFEGLDVKLPKTNIFCLEVKEIVEKLLTN